MESEECICEKTLGVGRVGAYGAGFTDFPHRKWRQVRRGESCAGYRLQDIKERSALVCHCINT